MNKQELQEHASEMEMETYQLAYKLMKAEKLMQLQSLCDFNIWFLSDISPLIVKDETIEFMLKNKDKFSKMSIDEFLKYDLLIYIEKPKTFEEFKKLTNG